MGEERMSEQRFLLLELRYTPVQVRAQIDNLSIEEREGCAGILSSLVAEETRFAARCARALQRPIEAPAGEEDFEALRTRTLALLESHRSAWSPAILSMVREQVRGDRARATEIANLRKVQLSD